MPSSSSWNPVKISYGWPVEQAYECDPLLLVVLEADNVTLEDFRAYFDDFRPLENHLFLLLFLLCGYEDAGTGTVAINGTSLAA